MLSQWEEWIFSSVNECNGNVTKDPIVGDFPIVVVGGCGWLVSSRAFGGVLADQHSEEEHVRESKGALNRELTSGRTINTTKTTIHPSLPKRSENKSIPDCERILKGADGLLMDNGIRRFRIFIPRA